MEIESQLSAYDKYLPDTKDHSVSTITANVILQTFDDSSQQDFVESPNFTTDSPSASLSPNSSGTLSPPAPNLLPPCRICGEKASGFHYGANTCEACKGFFRRSLARKETYRCSGSETCEIGPGKRNACGYCRYQKCIAVGMSKSAIKTGRYTHKKKSQDIREVKRLQEQARLKKEGKLVISTEKREEELEKIICHITEVHKQQTLHTPEFFKKLPEKEREFLEQRDLQQKMFGTMRPIPREEYMQIYQSTGIDIDGRREMIKHMIPCIEKAIKRFIAFAKALPGFKDLPVEDQIALIKASRVETWVISCHRAFNRDLMLFTDVCGYTLDMTELCKVHQKQHLESIFVVASKMKSLQLTTEEECLLKGICVLQSDRVFLRKPDMVDHCQSILLTAMEELVSKKHPCERFFIPRVIAILTEMRTLTEHHRRWEATIDMDWSSEFHFPPLLYEMASTSGHEHWMINACDYVNVTHRLYTSRTCGRTFHLIEDLGLLHSEEYLEHMLAAFSLLLRLELRLEERVLLCAASVLSAASRVETWHIWQHKSINVDLRLATTSWGDTLDLELLRGIVNHKELVDIKLGVIKHMQGLNLTMEETVIMGCLTMLSTDRCVLQETEKVETSQWLMIEALEYLLKKNHPEEKYMLAKCISILTELRTVSALHTKEEEKFTMDWSDKIEFPPLFYEIWST